MPLTQAGKEAMTEALNTPEAKVMSRDAALMAMDMVDSFIDDKEELREELVEALASIELRASSVGKEIEAVDAQIARYREVKQSLSQIADGTARLVIE